MQARRVLVIDDDTSFLEQCAMALAHAGCETVTVDSIAAAEATIAGDDEFDVVVLDLVFPNNGWGATLLPALRKKSPRPSVVVVSGFLHSGITLSLANECDLMLSKPLTGHELVGAVCECSRNAKLERGVWSFAKDEGLKPGHRDLLLLTVQNENLDDNEAAAGLGHKPSTVRTYWQRMLKKTGCSSRAALIAKLLRFLLVF